MPGNFPTITGGNVSRYPLVRRRTRRSTVLVFADMSEQRFRMGTPLDSFELHFSKVPLVDKDAIRAFWNNSQGPTDTTFSLVLNDGLSTVTYDHLQFTPGQVFEATEESAGLWSFILAFRRTRS